MNLFISVWQSRNYGKSRRISLVPMKGALVFFWNTFMRTWQNTDSNRQPLLHHHKQSDHPNVIIQPCYSLYIRIARLMIQNDRQIISLNQTQVNICVWKLMVHRFKGFTYIWASAPLHAQRCDISRFIGSKRNTMTEAGFPLISSHLTEADYL